MLQQAIYLMPKITWDSDALSFISSAGITDANQKYALNTYVKGLKSKNLWTEILALYPFIGGTATTHRYNLKNPATFLITFYGGVTHNANGITTDGSTGYGNMFFTPSVHTILNNEGFFLYSRTGAASPTVNEVDMGAAISTTQRDCLIVRTSSDSCRAELNGTAGGSNSVSTTTTSGLGLFMASRVSSTDLRLFRNGSQIGSTATSANTGIRSNVSMLIGARSVSGTASNFTARNYSLAGTSRGFTPTQALDFYNLTQAFQISLNRAV